MTDDSNEQHDNWRTAPDERSTHGPVPQDAEWSLTTQVPYDEDTGELTTTIVYAIAEAEGVEPQDIKNPPLYDVVDTDALEAACFGTRGETRTHDSTCSTEFMYRGFRVVVQGDGWVLVYERTDE